MNKLEAIAVLSRMLLPFNPPTKLSRNFVTPNDKLCASISSGTHRFHCLHYLRYDVENLSERTRECERESWHITDYGRHNESGIPSWAGALIEVIWI